jgi:hypothetical protein
LPEDLTFTLNPLKTLTIKLVLVLLIFFIVIIVTSALTFILTLALTFIFTLMPTSIPTSMLIFIILMVSAPALTKPTLTLNLLKPFIIKPAFLISFAVAIFTSTLTLTTPTEPTLLSTPKMAAALSPATCILTNS